MRENLRALFGVYSANIEEAVALAIAFSAALVAALIPSISKLALNDSNLVKRRISKSYRAIYLITVPSIFESLFWQAAYCAGISECGYWVNLVIFEV